MFYNQRIMATMLLTVASGTMAVAQANDPVRLESKDGNMTVTGTLLDAAAGQLRISTAAGVIELDASLVDCFGTSCPTQSITFDPNATVKLQSADGTVNISGKIQDFADGNYRLQTDLGVMRIKAENVECIGAGCPTTTATTVAAVTPNAGPNIVNPSSARVRFAGSDTVGFGLMPYLLDDYADYLNATAQRTDLSETEAFVSYVGADGRELTSLFVNSTGSGDATDALETLSAELGMTSRRQKDSEAQRMITAGTNDLRGTPNETVIAVDSLAVITHPSNPVRDLTMSEIGAMYLGQINNWSQVGGPDAPITVLSREDGSSTRGVFETAVFSGDEPPLGARVTYPGGDNPEMAAAVRDNPYAIGYVGFSFSEGLNRLDLTSACGIISTATPFGVKTEEYPLGRRLYLYNRPDNMPADARHFLEYALSPDADDAIAKSSFVNFAVERAPQSQSRRASLFNDLGNQTEFRLAAKMRDDMADWDRLSTTVRFPTGSSTLGRKEINDIDRLISFLETQPNGTRVAVVGFADSIGPFENNERLSGRRAEAVANSIASQARGRLNNITFETRAYSELAPAVCNTDENGRAINRRVEVWLAK